MREATDLDRIKQEIKRRREIYERDDNLLNWTKDVKVAIKELNWCIDLLTEINHLPETAKTGVGLIASERLRQINKEDYSLDHDWHHVHGELSLAAVCYTMPPTFGFRRYEDVPSAWPWGKQDWKPTPENRIKELAKAGALIAAEIDRLTACGFKP